MSYISGGDSIDNHIEVDSRFIIELTYAQGHGKNVGLGAGKTNSKSSSQQLTSDFRVFFTNT